MAKKNKQGVSGRNLNVRVKTAKGRKISSTRWLNRQLNDPFVMEAKKLGYRSRAAFKLAAIDDRFQFLTPGKRVLDLGAAPGSWTQIAVQRVNSLGNKDHPLGTVTSIDIKDIIPIPGATIITDDFMNYSLKTSNSLLTGPFDVILSDMAAPATGHLATDHIRIMGLLEAAIIFSNEVLALGGTFVGKVLKGGTESNTLIELKKNFRTVKHIKPPASRSDSREIFVIACEFQGKKNKHIY